MQMSGFLFLSATRFKFPHFRTAWKPSRACGLVPARAHIFARVRAFSRLCAHFPACAHVFPRVRTFSCVCAKNQKCFLSRFHYDGYPMNTIIVGNLMRFYAIGLESSNNAFSRKMIIGRISAEMLNFLMVQHGGGGDPLQAHISRGFASFSWKTHIF